MKKILALLTALLMLTGCTGKRELLDRAMTLRAKLLACESCSFDATVTADYGDELFEFTMNCVGDNDGNLTFTVAEPESIAGITGTVSAGEGKLTFDDVALEFALMADDQITPVSAPWLLLKTLLGGYLTACSQEDAYIRLTVDDSYADDALQLEIWLDSDDKPVNAEIVFDGRRIVTMEVANFQIQ